MELTSRAKNDRYTKPGQYLEIESHLRANTDNASIPVLVCYAFDWRTRLGPYLFADMRLLTGVLWPSLPPCTSGLHQATHRAAAMEPEFAAERSAHGWRPAAAAAGLQHANPQRQAYELMPMLTVWAKTGRLSWPAAPRPSMSHGTTYFCPNLGRINGPRNGRRT